MSFFMPVSEQAQVSTAEGVVGATQHVEHVTSVGPWALRRGSSSSWTAISSPGGRTRRGTVSSTIGNPSARIDASPSNPFSDAFAASLGDSNPFLDGNTSEASSSTAAASSMEAADSQTNEKSEFTRTIEEIDRQAEEVQEIVGRESLTTSDDGAERASSRIARELQAPRSRSPGSRSQEHAPAPAPVRQQPQPPTRVLTRRAPTRNVQREAVEALHEVERGTIECYTCKQRAQVAAVGIWMFGATLLLVIASMIIFLTMEGKFGTKLFQGLLGFPFAALWSAMSIALFALLAMKWPEQWGLTTGGRFFLWWLFSVGFAVFIYYLVIGLVFEFGLS